MRCKQLYFPTRKEVSTQVTDKAHQLLLRAGYIRQLSVGIYYMLPLGMRVLNNIMQIIHKHARIMQLQEMTIPLIQPLDLLQESGRYDNLESSLFQMLLKKQKYFLIPTAEEAIVHCISKDVVTYHQLPFSIYQIGTKFRNELRARGGLLRCKEFLMFDAYSFHEHVNSLSNFYKQMHQMYENIFKEISLHYIVAKSSNLEMGGDLSHEFLALTNNGESVCYQLPDQTYVTEELLSQESGAQKKERGTEIGHIFQLGTYYSGKMNGRFTDRQGKNSLYVMGCYGIGISRLLSVLVEQHHDHDGMRWPISIAPFIAIILTLHTHPDIMQVSEKIYQELMKNRFEVLLDDRNQTLGSKLVEADLIGIPYQIIINYKEEKTRIALRHRANRKEEIIHNVSDILDYFSNNLPISFRSLYPTH